MLYRNMTRNRIPGLPHCAGTAIRIETADCQLEKRRGLCGYVRKQTQDLKLKVPSPVLFALICQDALT